ncbi:acyl-CoA dehydrogenase family protein [Streptomyces sp. GQFP]|uniref:acyl-CoA dehydrogenase family protein n=1 Tax=Streptomyces sp. GQFP TaxID=2907545 RepID=UPI001F2873AD|nr:acyl-CoA dehydrogenase family protein [Streptomyces sp. GQFP]UIX31960.1 acyl-CoA dehydrogenase [Streptomyces sp. GQFP]
MRFARTDEQQFFAEVVAGLSARLAGPDEVRRAWAPASDEPAGAALWAALDDVGLLSLLAPDGGGSELELVSAIEELGRACTPGPVVEHAAVAVPLLAALAPELLADTSGVFTASTSDLVPYAARASGVLLLEDERLLLVEGSALDAAASVVDSLDGSRMLVRISPDQRAGARVLASGAEVAAQLARARDRAALCTAALLVGLSARAIEMTVDYDKVRLQFGVPVGSFQAVKHQLANAHVAVEFARPLVEAAAWAMSTDAPDASRLCSMAKVSANKAGRLAAKTSLQCHGAIGYTMEADLHLYLMRIWSLLNAWGGTDEHRERVARDLLDAPVAS